MQRPGQQTVFTPIPAAQYVRMSDEQQQYSIDNQKAAIQEYADAHGFVIVKTYADAGKSGVAAKHRTALRELLKDVVTGDAKYSAILVYDVSRWGRFPNNDEAAHYEFLCFSSGVPLHYCAEPFANDGTASSSLLKALKRSMAAEFSRELSEKVIRGKTRIVQLGYWVGGQAGYGYRRMMVSASGKPKQKMKSGEYKNLTTDRVILVHGPSWEVKTVRLMFSMSIGGSGGTAIARELNRRGISCNGKPWGATDVYHIVTNPKYAGWNVWNRGSERLQKKRIRNPPQQWIMRPGAFVPIVDQETYDRAQACRPKKADFLWSDSEMLQRVRRLLKLKGRLSETLILKARGMPSTTTLHSHFGPYRRLYEMVGYHLEPEDIFKGAQSERSLKLRRKVVNAIRELFSENVTVTHLPCRTRSVLLIDHSFMVSVLLCRSKRKRGTLIWVVEPNSAERDFITLLCTMNRSHDRVIDYFLLPDMRPFRKLCFHDGRLGKAVRLHGLAEFYTTAKKMWVGRTSTADSPAHLVLPEC
jgi:DNA invertase Pin-like site-specific DNA recombinase